MRKLCFIMTAVLLSCFCLSCDTGEGFVDNKSGILTDEIHYSKEDYQFELGRFAGLGEETEWQIVQAYFKKLQSDGGHGDLTINDVWVEKYFGAYCSPSLAYEQEKNGKDWDEIYYAPENQTVFAVMVDNKNQDNDTEQREVSIQYSRGRAFVREGNRIFLWYDGQLYDLADHHFNKPRLLYDWDFLGIANLQNGLDTKTQSRIQEDFGNFRNSSWREVPIHYLGTYNNYITFMAYASSTATIFHIEVGGIHFYAPSGGMSGNTGTGIYAWKEGQIYRLQELYKQSLITREDLIEMEYNHGYYKGGPKK